VKPLEGALGIRRPPPIITAPHRALDLPSTWFAPPPAETSCRHGDPFLGTSRRAAIGHATPKPKGVGQRQSHRREDEKIAAAADQALVGGALWRWQGGEGSLATRAPLAPSPLPALSCVGTISAMLCQLCFVTKSILYRNHMKILTFSDTLSFKIYLRR
jgi:hypothetical protein